MRGDSANDTAQLAARSLLLAHQKIKISAGSSHQMSLLFCQKYSRPPKNIDHLLRENVLCIAQSDSIIKSEP